MNATIYHVYDDYSDTPRATFNDYEACQEWIREHFEDPDQAWIEEAVKEDL